MLLCICKTHFCIKQLWEGTVLMTQDTENLTQREVILQSWFLAFPYVIAMLKVISLI